MDEETSLAMRQLLICQICLCDIEHPRALPCLHSFCLQCLQSYMQSQSVTSYLNCPVCRQLIDVPPEGVSAFPMNHWLVSLRDVITARTRGPSEVAATSPADGSSTSQSCTDDNASCDTASGDSLAEDGGTATSSQSAPYRWLVDQLRMMTVDSEEITNDQTPTTDHGSNANGTNHNDVPTSTQQTDDRTDHSTNTRPIPASRVDHGRIAAETADHRATSTGRTDHILPFGTRDYRPIPSSRADNRSIHASRTDHRAIPGTRTDYRPIPASRPDHRPIPAFRRSASAIHTSNYEPRVFSPYGEAPGTLYPVPVFHDRAGALIAFGQYGQGLVDFTNPVGLEMMACGNIVVSDQRGRRVIVFSSTGIVKTMFACRSEVRDLAVTSTSIAVAVKGGRALAHEFLHDGQPLQDIGESFSQVDAYGIAVDYVEGSRYVLATCPDNNCALLLKSGRLLSQFRGRLASPSYAALHGDKAWVCDRATVRQYSATGKLKVTITQGIGRSHVSNPAGICVDNGAVLVADQDNRRVQRYAEDGQFINTLLTVPVGLSPLNVAVGHSKMAVLLVGSAQAEVRIYPYKHYKPWALQKHHSCPC